MPRFSITTTLACLASVCLCLQGANAQDCATPKLQTCATNFAAAAAAAGQDKTKICSAANSYLDCVNKVVTDCKLDPNSSSIINQAITTAKQELAQAGCGNGASGSVYSVVAIVLGVFLHRLF
ncbi:uncharacterized protein LOC130049137 [Ostrea edulis]|uniref:uncharacterized protein LOC130049137 n=1 Tax=Ostrea edulis TaxID=37623 RepID=UPI0024AFAEC4|nr:uncharacterized protein LOC130049137 [Ostrea edulis]